MINYIQKEAGTSKKESVLIYEMLDEQIKGSDNIIYKCYTGSPDSKCKIEGYNPDKTYRQVMESDPHLRGLKDNVHYDIKNFSKKSHEEKVQYLMTSGKNLNVALEKLNDAGSIGIAYIFDHTRLQKLDSEVNNSAEKISVTNIGEINNLKKLLEDHSLNIGRALVEWKMIDDNHYNVKLPTTNNNNTSLKMVTLQFTDIFIWEFMHK